MQSDNLILLSGGMDSTVLLHKYGAALCVGFDYGQPHKIELEYARKTAEDYGVPFEVHTIPNMPKINDVVFAGRNAVLASMGAAVAQSRGLKKVFIGCNFSDHERFPDCRITFLSNLSKALEEAYGVVLCYPLVRSTKAQIVQYAKENNLSGTWTCYSPTEDGKQCGECYSCKGLVC
jgi:7-cyano-7-deazaguanine synthase